LDAVVARRPAVRQLRGSPDAIAALRRHDLVVEVDEVRRPLEVRDALVRQPRAELVVDAALGAELYDAATALLRGDRARHARRGPADVNAGVPVGPRRTGDDADP